MLCSTAFLSAKKRVTYVNVTDSQAIDALKKLTQLEGILPALESSHAVAYALILAKKLKEKKTTEKMGS